MQFFTETLSQFLKKGDRDEVTSFLGEELV